MLSHCHPMLVALKWRHIAGTRAQEPLGGALASDDRQDRGESFRRRRQLSAGNRAARTTPSSSAAARGRPRARLLHCRPSRRAATARACALQAQARPRRSAPRWAHTSLDSVSADTGSRSASVTGSVTGAAAEPAPSWCGAARRAKCSVLTSRPASSADGPASADARGWRCRARRCALPPPSGSFPPRAST
jgi:hypothetical protein